MSVPYEQPHNVQDKIYEYKYVKYRRQHRRLSVQTRRFISFKNKIYVEYKPKCLPGIDDSPCRKRPARWRDINLISVRYITSGICKETYLTKKIKRIYLYQIIDYLPHGCDEATLIITITT